MIWNIPQAVLVISVLSAICWTPGLMNVLDFDSSVRWPPPTVGLFTRRHKEPWFFFFCLFFNSLHCLFGSSSRSLLADGELCWDVEFVVGVKFRRCSKTCERAQCRLSASSPGLDTLHFLASIQRQLELKTFRKRLKSGLNSNLFWVESDASPASEGFYFVEVRQP